jgi:AraC-like DNA-binding protein
MQHRDGEGNLIRFPDEKKKELLTLCHEIYQTAKDGKSVSVYSLAIAILEFCRGGLDSLRKSQDMPLELLDFLHQMELHLDVFPTVKEVCDALFLTPSTALRLFRKYLGVSPRQYLEIRRLDIARKHLRNGISVTDTALLVGYAETSAFIRLFRQHFGYTPLKYQQSKEK